MQCSLAGRLRLELEFTGGRAQSRAFVGERELPATPALIEALIVAERGGVPSPEQHALLSAHGVLATPDETAGSAAWSRAMLSPHAALELRTAARHEAALPISLFVPPPQLGAVQRLAATLRGAWLRMLQVADGRGLKLVPGEAQRTLSALSREELACDPVLAADFALDARTGALRPRAPLQHDAIQHRLNELRIHPERPPSPARPLRRSLAELGLTLPALGRLLGRLARGPVTPDPAHAGLLAALAEAPGGLWVDADAAPAARTLSPGTLSHLGHATLLANLGGAYVLVDPWLPAARAGEAAPPLAVAALPPLAGIFLTHHHWDHLHIETLLKLDKDTPIYVPRQPPASARALTPRSEALLTELGFARVHALAPGDEVALGDGGRVVAASFHGEDPTDLGYAGCTYVLVHQGRAALAHADGSTDGSGRSLVSTGEAARLRARWGPLCPLLATRRQERSARVLHPWEFLLLPAARWVEPAENCCNDAAFLAALSEACGARTLILYAEGGADFYPPDTDFLRRPGSPARMAPHEHLWDSLEDITRAVAAVGTRTHLSDPGQVYRIGGDGPV